MLTQLFSPIRKTKRLDFEADSRGGMREGGVAPPTVSSPEGEKKCGETKVQHHPHGPGAHAQGVHRSPVSGPSGSAGVTSMDAPPLISLPSKTQQRNARFEAKRPPPISSMRSLSKDFGEASTPSPRLLPRACLYCDNNFVALSPAAAVDDPTAHFCSGECMWTYRAVNHRGMVARPRP